MPTDGSNKPNGAADSGLPPSTTTTSSPMVNKRDLLGLSALSHSPKMTGSPQTTRELDTKLDDESTSSLSDFYLSESHPGQLDLSAHSDRTSPNSGPVMSEYVQRIASGIYSEFEAMIEAYGLPVVERLMPLVIGLLENLDELHKDQAAYHAEVDQLREQCTFVKGELERETQRRKQSELRLLQAEDAFEEDRKTKEDKLEELTAANRQAELRFQNTKDQLSRMEAKEAEWKKEGIRLHERINELIRSNVDLTNQVKFVNRQRPTSGRPIQGRLGASAAPTLGLYEEPVAEATPASHPEPGTTFDATSGGGFGFDEMPSNEEGTCVEDEIPAGMWKEIDTLIKENMELVETKNALNVVKDDLLAKIDSLTFENTSLRESVAHLTQVRSRLQAELASADQLLHNARSEVDELKERMTALSSKHQDSAGGAAMHKKRFTRAEMARVLSERNQFKERLMELQETIRFTETLRAGQKGHPELLVGLSGAGSKLTPAGVPSGSGSTANAPQSGRLQSLQNFFAAFSANNRADGAGDRCGTPMGQSTAIRNPVSHSWVTLSQKHTGAPIYGWCEGLNASSTPTLTRAKTNNTDQSTVPMPVQCRMVGGLHRRQIEIAAALVVPASTTREANSRIWLIGRGPIDTLVSTGSPGSTVASSRGYVGQVHIFEPSRFSQPVHSFDLDAGFMPTSAVYVQPSRGSQSGVISAEPDDSDTIQFAWEFVSTDVNPEADHVILASNDGRFLLLRIADELTSAHPDLGQKDAWIVARFQVIDAALVANCMLSVDHFTCLSLSNPNGLSQLICMQLPGVVRSAQETNLTTHCLLSIPGEARSTGPMVMTREPLTDGRIWLGTAGSGQCHCFAPQGMKFVHLLTLPVDTPCLHAIEVQPAGDSSSAVVWLAVSGSGFTATQHAPNCEPTATPVQLGDANKGMARLLAFDAERQEVLRMIDLTGALSMMIDTDGVTDPVDLTICRLLLVSESDKKQTIWFATRSGFVGRLQLDDLHVGSNANPSDLQVLPASSVSVSCHGYRRPVCNLIPVRDMKPGGEFLIVAVGHDYVHLRPQQQHMSEQASHDNITSSSVVDSLSRLRQMGSGAHAIVWRINTVHA